MKINFIVNWTWPLDVQCSCGTDFSPETANDFYRTKNEKSEIVYYTQCPICGKKFIIPAQDIPSFIRDKVVFRNFHWNHLD